MVSAPEAAKGKEGAFSTAGLRRHSRGAAAEAEKPVRPEPILSEHLNPVAEDVVAEEVELRQRAAGESMQVCRKANTFVKDWL